MKVLGILAGPRKGHTTDKIIDAVLEGLRANGGQIEKISLYDCDIKPCMACEACVTTGKCVIQDDQEMLLEKLDKADVVVFGSPTYWCNVTSQAKVFFDRMVPFFKMGKMGPVRTKDKPSKVVLVTSCGMPFPLSHIFKVIPGCITAMKWPFSRMKAKIKTIYCAGMIDSKTSVPSKKILEKAYLLGKKL